MFPRSTYVLDHLLPVWPDELFDVVEDFVRPHLSDPIRPFGVGPIHFTLSGVEWTTPHPTIDVKARLYVPRQVDRWCIQVRDRYESVPTPTVAWDEFSSTTLLQIEAVPSNDKEVHTRLAAHPGTEVEQLALRLAAHVVRETACNSYRTYAALVAAQDAAYAEWLSWLEAELARMMSEKQAADEAFVFPVQRRITIRSLRTTVDVFVDALWMHLKRFPLPDILAPQGIISLRAAYSPASLNPLRLPSVYLSARHHHTIPKDEETGEPASPTLIGPVIFVEPFPRSNERIDVVVTCLRRSSETCIEEIVKMIGQWYPESYVAEKDARPEKREQQGVETSQATARLVAMVKELNERIAVQSAVAMFSGPDDSTQQPRVAEPTTAGGEAPNRLPPVDDPTDQQILKWVTEDPRLSDRVVADRLHISRQAVNTRRNKLKAMGYKVR